jgi:hypothetical protein
MSELVLDPYWARVEARFRAISVALSEGNPESLNEEAAALQQLAVDLQAFLNSGGTLARMSPALLQRMQELLALMPVLRDALYRRSAYVDQALATLVPVAAEATYGSGGNAKYGVIPKQSGTLKTVAA